MAKLLDKIDKKILNILQENARASIKDIAAQVFLSSPAVSARMERMEQEGIIEGYHLKLNYDAIGYPIRSFIRVEIEPKQRNEFYPFIEASHNVLCCNCITGDFSMLVETMFESTEALDAFILELQKFGRTNTQIVFTTAVERREIRFQEEKE